MIIANERYVFTKGQNKVSTGLLFGLIDIVTH